MAIRHITCKLGNMRKAQEFIVYPKSTTTVDNAGEAQRIIIQSDHRICAIDPVTRKGMLSVNKANGAYFVHLNLFMGATVVDIPDEVVAQAVFVQPKTGDR